MMFAVVLLVLGTSNCLAQGVTFLEGPSDAYVAVGDEARFNCSYNGTLDLPNIIINGRYFTFFSLPARHRFEHMEVIIDDVQPSDNGSEYQCAFPSILSTSGHIIVSGINTTAEQTSELLTTTAETTSNLISTVVATSAREYDIVITTSVSAPVNPLSMACSHCGRNVNGIIAGVLVVVAFLSFVLFTVLAIAVCYEARKMRTSASISEVGIISEKDTTLTTNIGSHGSRELYQSISSVTEEVTD